MTQTNVTPSGDSNQPAENAEPIDNMGNPVNADGSPREVTKTEETDGDGGESIESLKKALKDTKAELTRLQQGKETSSNEDENSQNDDTEKNLQIQEKKAEDKGIDMSKYSESYNKNGGLTEDDYAELAEKGLDKETVDSYIAGREAIAKQQANELMGSVGGEENFAKVIEWAGENLSEGEINAYNSLVQKGELTQASLLLKGIHAQYKDVNGSPPNLMTGSTNAPSGDTFKSQHDMVKAMQDPRYSKDPDYTKEVQDKATRSHKAGTI